MTNESDDAVERARVLVARAERIVVFTGAGVSTESGIPDFRSPGGVWTKFDPREFTFERFLASDEMRALYWARAREAYAAIRAARPNAAHDAIAALARRGKVSKVVTQNIDGLHQRAGSPEANVIELHGTAHRVRCLECGKEWPRDLVESWLDVGTRVPRCDACGGILKPATVSFGQPMPERETAEAFGVARACDLLLTVGTSLVVYPAAGLVPAAREAGASIVIVNLDPTEYDGIADVVVRAKAAEALPRIVK